MKSTFVKYEVDLFFAAFVYMKDGIIHIHVTDVCGIHSTNNTLHFELLGAHRTDPSETKLEEEARLACQQAQRAKITGFLLL